jgi:hypothetical protein
MNTAALVKPKKDKFWMAKKLEDRYSSARDQFIPETKYVDKKWR